MAKFSKNKVIWNLCLIGLPLIAVFFSLFVGKYSIGLSEIADTVFRPSLSTPANLSVIWQLRLPRALAAAFVGASLSASGAAFQGVFRNPLVNSGLLGVSNGAAFGAALAIVCFGAGVYTYLLSFAFAVLAVLLSYLSGKIYGTVPNVTLILGGVVVSAFFGALTSIMKLTADTYSQLPAITFWMMGSFASINYTHFIAFVPMTVGMAVIYLYRWRINVLSMGDKEAASLGVNVKRCKRMIIFGATLSTASAVCISGVIGWIGLVIPHICRMLAGSDNNRLIPFSISLGAVFLVITDLLARNLTSSEIPVGILTAVIGTPFFVYLLKKTKGGGWR